MRINNRDEGEAKLPPRARLSFDISGDKYDAHWIPKNRDGEKITHGGLNVYRHIEYAIDRPLNKQFSPVLELFGWALEKSALSTRFEQNLLGLGDINLQEYLYKD